MKKILNLLVRDLKDSKNSLIATLLITFLLGVLWASVFPVVSQNAEAFALFAENGGAFELLFNIDGLENIDFSNYDVYIATAIEAENGTLALLLAQPVSRIQIAISQIGALAIKTFIAGAGAMLSVYLPSLFLQNVDVDALAWFKFGLYFVLVMLSISFSTIFFSTIFLSKSKGIWITTFIIAGGYVLNSLAKMVDDLDFLKYFSFWHYYGQPLEYLQGNAVNSYSLLVFFAIIMLTTVLTPLVLKRKDLPAG